MRSGKDAVGIIWVQDHRPNAPAGKFHVLVIDTLPFVAGIHGLVNAAVAFERTRDQYLVRIIRIDQDAREVA